MDRQPLVSILINNYNYGQFLREAIDSALVQTYPNVEVIVVDDGSTDDSRQIIASYGDRIIPLLKENGGQTSAINAGFAASHGELICLLDSDDVFVSTKVAHLIDAIDCLEDTSIVYHQTRVIDGDGQMRGRPRPHGMWRGDISDRVARSGGWWPHPTTSGLGFSRPFLNHVMPISEEKWGRRGCDTYLASLAPFNGQVVGVAAPLTYYRIHGANEWGSLPQNHETFCLRVDRYVDELQRVRALLDEHSWGRLVSARMSIDDHFMYQRYLHAAHGKPPRRTVFGAIWRCPVLPARAKLRESLKQLLRKY